jgi:alpha-1,2-mannosyltransferase
VPATAARRPAAVPVTVAACAALALALRAYQLSRPGYLLGVTEYDDGVLFGNALRLVSGVVPYRDFAMVQPPGSALLMVPVALLAKVTGTAWGLAVARILTVGADTANVVLLGVLVRHRGPVTAGVACGLYAVYPDALVAAHTFLLEPWLNLCCLAAAALIFDGDRLAAADTRRLALGGAAFGFAVAVKIWALVPLAVAGLVVLASTRRARPALTLAAGAAAGLGVPLAPFAVLAPGGLARGVLVGQLVRNASGGRDLTGRLAELAGAQGLLSLPARFPRPLLLAAIGAAIAGLYAAAYLAAGRRPAALDAYALLGAVAVTGMLLWPRLYYPHYGAFDGPFLALAVALPAGLLPDALLSGPMLSGALLSGGLLPRGPLPGGPLAASRAVGAVLAVVLAVAVAAAGVAQVRAGSRLAGTQVAAAADRLIPAGACVVTNDSAYTVAAGRFYSDVAGCPAMTDSFGTLIAMTGGHPRDASPAALAPVVALWHATLEQATYVWLTGDTVAQIPWNSGLYGYFRRHFRLIGLAGQPVPWRDVPRPGLYLRT